MSLDPFPSSLLGPQTGKLRSAITGIAWPPVPSVAAAQMVSALQQLALSECWEPERMRAHQLAQLRRLLRHAVDYVPYYNQRCYREWLQLPDTEAWQGFAALPVVSRAEAQAAGEALFARALPREHGEARRATTSGSTGRPLTYAGTEVNRFLWHVLAMREHLWHGRDFSLRHAFIRSGGDNRIHADWGLPANQIFSTGESLSLGIGEDIRSVARRVRTFNPDYLLTSSAIVLELVRYLPREVVPRLRQVRSVGGTVSPDMRETIRRQWGVEVADMYSCTELGALAFQCPGHDHYHVQAESVLIEIVDDAGVVCLPGVSGRVVATGLHGWASPLVRYDLGDHALLRDAVANSAEPCCHRQLPVMERILGRRYHRARAPDGGESWPSVGGWHWENFPMLERFRIVQAPDLSLRFEYLAGRDLDADEIARLRDMVLGKLGFEAPFQVSRLSHLPLGVAGKFEDFVSEVYR